MSFFFMPIKTYRAGLCFLFFFSSIVAFSQNTISLYHLKEKTSRVFMYNPAEVSDAKVNTSMIPVLSGIDMGGSVPFSFNDVLKPGTSQGEYVIDRNVLLDKISNSPKGLLLAEFSTSLMYVGLKPKNSKFAYSLFANLVAFAEAGVNRDAVDVTLVGFGTKSNLGRNFQAEGSARVAAYTEIGIGLQREFKDKNFSIGANLKFIQGYTYGSTNNLGGTLRNNPDNYDISLSTKNYQLYGLFSDKQGYYSDLFGLRVDRYAGFNSGYGYGIDLGGVYDFKKITGQPLKLSVSVLNIGQIFWNDVPITSAKVRDFNFTANNAGPDYIKDFNSVKTNSYENVSMWLPTKVISSVSYELTKKDAFYLTSINRFGYASTFNLNGLGYTRKIWKERIALTANAINYNLTNFDVGFGFSFNFHPIQFYIASDNVVSAVNFLDARRLNASLGLSIAIRDRTPKEKKVKQYKFEHESETYGWEKQPTQVEVLEKY